MAEQIAGIPEDNLDTKVSNPNKQQEIADVKELEDYRAQHIKEILENPSLPRDKAGELRTRTKAVREARAEVAAVNELTDKVRTDIQAESREKNEKGFVQDHDLALEMATAEDALQTKAVEADKEADPITAKIHRQNAEAASSKVREVAQGTMDVAANIEAAMGKSAAGDVRAKGFETAAEAGAAVSTDLEAKRQQANKETAEAVNDIQGIVTETGQSQVTEAALRGVKIGYKISEVPFSERTITEPNGARVYERFLSSESTPGLVLVERYSAASGQFIDAIAIKGESNQVSQPETRRNWRLQRRPTGAVEPTPDVLARLDTAKQVYRKVAPTDGTGDFSAENGDNLGAYLMRKNGASDAQIESYTNGAGRTPRRTPWFLRPFRR